ncbi:MAG: hypothetical protein QW518_08930 [Thermofilaceae archaeon]
MARKPKTTAQAAESLAKQKLSFQSESPVTLEPGVYAFRSVFPFSINQGENVVFSNVKAARLVVVDDNIEFTFKHVFGFFPSSRRLRMTDPVDPVPHEAMLSEPRPLTLQEQIARFLGEEFARRNADDQIETFEEADDFDIDDEDDLPLTKYELPDAEYEEPEPRPKPPAKAPEKPSEKPEPDPKQVPSPPPENVT